MNFGTLMFVLLWHNIVFRKTLYLSHIMKNFVGKSSKRNGGHEAKMLLEVFP